MTIKTKKQHSNSRSTSKLPTRVFAFGCLRPEPEIAQWLADQAFKANDVQAAMVRNETATRLARQRIIGSYVPEYAAAVERATALTTEIDGLYESLAKERQRKRKRLHVAQIETRIEGAKDERKAAWEQAKASKQPFLAAMRPWWEELKRVKAELLMQSGKKGSRAKGDAQRAALQQMAQSKDVPLAWLELARSSETDNAAHCEIRRKDWRPQNDTETPEYIQERRARVWGEDLDQAVKELAREAFLAAKKKTAEEGGRMHEPRGSEGRVGLIFDKNEHPTVGADGTINHRRLCLEPREDRRDPESKRAQKKCRMRVRLLIGGRAVQLNTVVHRPLPVGATVKRAWIQLRERQKYELHLVLQAAGLDQRDPAKRLEAIAVKPTWRAAEPVGGKAGPVIVADWVGSDGASGVIQLDAHTNQALIDVEQLRKAQDDYHNEAIATVHQYLATIPEDSEPELRVAMKGSASWRSPRHLAAIAYGLRGTIPGLVELRRLWKVDCLKVGADFFLPVDETRTWLHECGISDERVVLAVYLEWWRLKNRHLRSYEQNKRATALLRRREHYRIAAKQLAGRYEKLKLCRVGLKQAARSKLPEQDIAGPEREWAGQRRRAAPSVLTSVLANAFRVKEGRARVKAKTPAEALGLGERSGDVKTTGGARTRSKDARKGTREAA